VAAPATALEEAIHETKAREDFTRLSGEGRLLVLAAVLAYGREQLLTGEGAADQAQRLITAVTGSSRLGEAVARAARKWAGRIN
jgi:hypothetical protein